MTNISANGPICKQEKLLNENQVEELLNYCQSILDESPEGFSNLETEHDVCAAFAGVMFESNVEFSNLFYLLRNIVQDISERKFRNYSDKTISLIENVALRFIISENVDNRANAMYLLVWLAGEKLSKRAVNHIFEVLRVEENDAVVRIVIDFLAKANFRKTKKRLSITALSVLRDPYGWNSYSKSETFNLLPESIRLFALKGKGLNEEILTMEERLFLVRQRLEYLLESQAVSISHNNLDTARVIFQISDVEVTFRELHGLLFEYGKPRNFNNDRSKIYGLVCDIICDFVQQSSMRNGKPLVYMEEYAVDFLLPILLICLKEERLITEIEIIYQRVCEIFQEYSSYGNEVPAYKFLFEKVKKGMSIEDAKFNHDFLNLMREASDYRRNQTLVKEFSQ